MATYGSYGKIHEIRSKRKWETTTDLKSHFRGNQLEYSTRKHITCYSCGDQGHFSEECPRWNGSLTASLWSFDGSQEKILVSQDQLCLPLNSYEQKVENIYHQDIMYGTITCLVCGGEGHYSCDCPMKDQKDKVICTLCNIRGHCRFLCCKQVKSKKRACTRCGERGHSDSTHGLSCSSCDEYHQHGECPMRKVTCLFCECQDHYLAQCPLNSVCNDQREKFQAALRLGLSKQGNTLSTPAKPSTGSPTPANLSTGSPAPVNPSTASPTPANTSTASQVCKSGSAKSSPLVTVDNVPTLVLICFNCNEEGHYSYKCPQRWKKCLKTNWVKIVLQQFNSNDNAEPEFNTQRENFQAALRLGLSKQGNTLSGPAKPFTGSQVCKPGSAKKSAGKKPISEVAEVSKLPHKEQSVKQNAIPIMRTHYVHFQSCREAAGKREVGTKIQQRKLGKIVTELSQTSTS